MKIQLFYTHRISPKTKKWSGGTTANEQISWNFFRRATEKGHTCSVHYFGDSHIKPNKSDICICHPGGALKALAAAKHPNLYMICPWSCHSPNLKGGGQHNWIIPQFDAVRKIFGLGGKIWEERAADPNNGYHKWYKKLHRIPMGVDANRFENWKQNKFNPPGKRGFLFMGSYVTWKGINEMKSCFENKPYHLWLCGDGKKSEITNNIHNLGMVNNCGPELKKLIQAKVDYYIHMSIFDAQATTILENTMHGLVPACTPESGFKPSFTLHPTKNIEENRKLLDELQNKPCEELIKKSKQCIEVIKRENNWNSIIDSILNAI